MRKLLRHLWDFSKRTLANQRGEILTASAMAALPYALTGLAAGGGILGSMGVFGKGKQGEPERYEFMQNPQYSHTEPRLQLINDFVSSNLQRIQEGKAPVWYEQFAPQLKQQQQQGLYSTYYGGPLTYGGGQSGGPQSFQPGVLESQKAFDVQRGLGGGAGAGRNYSQQLFNYAQQSQAIDDYISKLGYQAQAEGAYKFPQLGLSIPRGPEGQWQRLGGTPYQPSAGEQIGGQLLSMLPSMMSGLPSRVPSQVTPLGAGVEGGQQTGMWQQPTAPLSYSDIPTGSSPIYSPQWQGGQEPAAYTLPGNEQSFWQNPQGGFIDKMGQLMNPELPSNAGRVGRDILAQNYGYQVDPNRGVAGNMDALYQTSPAYEFIRNLIGQYQRSNTAIPYLTGQQGGIR